MRRGNLNHNCRRLLTVLVLLFSLSIGNAWASSYKTDFKATGGASGQGYVYASKSSTATPVYETTSDNIDATETSANNSSGTTAYYAWAKAVRGYEFAGWSLSSANTENKISLTTDNKGVADKITVTSAVNGTTTGTATAQWTTYTKVDVTYNKSDDGEYTVAYSYNTYDATYKTITAGDAKGLGCTINSDNGSKTIGSYYNDVITLTSTKGDFQGWYKASDTINSSNLLSTDNPYTYVAPQSGTGAIYPKYAHTDKYYGRLTASIAAVPYSMPAGGMIFISKEEAATPSYSENAQTVDNVGMGTTSLTYYLKAQPTDKRYVFRGWYSNAQCTGAPISTKKEYTYSFTASSTNSESPTEGNVYAAFDFNLYYMQVEVEPGTASQGLGMVIVSDQSLGTPEYTQYASYAEQFLYAYRLAPTANAYLYAKAKYGYTFSGWYDNAACTGTALSTANPYTYAATGTSTDPMNPTIVPVYAKFVEDATTVNITYNKPDQTKGEYTASVLDIAEVDDEYIWTFTEVFTSEGKTANTVQAQHKTDVLRLEAACKAGYGVTSWSDNGTDKSSLSYIYQATATSDKSFGVTFGDAKPFLVSASTSDKTGTAYASLAEALSNIGSNKKITVVQNAYVPAGTYTIPNGVTLLVPFSADYTVYTTQPSDIQNKAEGQVTTAYSTLTLASGAKIIVENNAAISVSAKMCASSGGAAGSGSINGQYGCIDMLGTSNIEVKNGGKLYVWGYIYSSDCVKTINDKKVLDYQSSVIARSGATIYEAFQMGDNHGGTCYRDTYSKVFVTNQYSIQNIEVPLTIEYGAMEKVMGSLYIQGYRNTAATFIGSGGLFTMSSGASVVKSYDPITDRQVYDVYGTVTLASISVTVSVATVDSKNYVLPLTNNMTLNLHSGATANVTYAMSMLPGVEINVDAGATCNISSSLFAYDADEWCISGVKYGMLGWTKPLKHTAYNGNNNYKIRNTYMATTKLPDAKIKVNGTLNVNGYLLTTSSGANICSDGDGKIYLKNGGSRGSTALYQVDGTSSSVTTISAAIAAKLKNEDGSYVATAGADANANFFYNKNYGQWMQNPKTVTWNANGGTTEATTMAYSQDAFIGELPAAYRDGYTLAGWFTAASGGTQIAPTTKVNANVTYYAHWTANQYEITYKDQGKAEFSSTHIDEPNAHPTKHTYGTGTALNEANNKIGYDFGGWHTISNCKAESKVTSLSGDAFAKDITLYAKWVPQEYAITYKDKDDADFSGTSWASTQPTTHTYGMATTLVNPSKANYTFGGWYTTSACTGSAVTSLDATAYTSGPITLYAKWNETIHTVTVAAGANGSVSPESVSGVGVATASGNITATPNTGYSFSGWTLPESGVTAASGYTTSNNPIHINATADGKTITANWTMDTYNLTYEGLNGATNSNPATYTVETATITLANPGERSGYTFTGWTCGGSAITQIANGSTGDKTITANWTIDTYNLTYEGLNGATNSNPATYTVETATITLANPGTRAGYTFDGWTCGGSAITQIANGSTGDKTITANWTLNTYTLTFTVNNAQYGTVDEPSITVPYGSTLSIDGKILTVGETFVTASPEEKTAQYTYTFKQWNIEPDVMIVTSDMTIEAEFERTVNKYTITWWDAQETLENHVIAEEEYEYGATPSYTYNKPSDYAYSYEMLGWSPEIVIVTENKTYTARYKDIPLTLVVNNEQTIANNVTLNSTTVRVSGALHVANNAKLTTTDLILEAAEGSSGEVTGDIVATNVYFDLAIHADSRHWNVFGVPFEIGDLGNTKLQYKNNEETTWHDMILGSHYDIIYFDEATRASSGPVYDCWKYIEDLPAGQRTLQPGVAYSISLLYHVDTLRFTKASGKPIHYNTAVGMTNTGDATNGGWNGIANPKTYHALLATGVDMIQIHDGGEIGKDTYYAYPIANYKFVVGKAGYVQITAENSVLNVATAGGQDPIPSPVHAAPRRTNGITTSELYTIEFSAENMRTDRVYVKVDEDKADEYTIGSDVMKFSTSQARPQIWVEQYNMKLCKSTMAPVDGQTVYPLGLCAPAAGEYTITNDQSAVSGDDNTLYLTYDGLPIWNLSDAPYSIQLEKGTNTHYGLLIVRNQAPSVTTGTEVIQTGLPAAQKVIWNDQVYILRGGEVYTVTGKKVQ